jgi:hypothetical protein
MKRSYVLEFKRVTDTRESYVSETQKLAETQHLDITQGLKRLFKDTQWTVEQLSFVTGHKSVSASVWLQWYDLLNLFRSYWSHRLGVSDGLLQVLGHNVRVKTQEVQSYQLQSPEQCVNTPV